MQNRRQEARLAVVEVFVAEDQLVFRIDQLDDRTGQIAVDMVDSF